MYDIKRNSFHLLFINYFSVLNSTLLLSFVSLLEMNLFVTGSVDAVFETSFDWVINCAGETKLGLVSSVMDVCVL